MVHVARDQLVPGNTAGPLQFVLGLRNEVCPLGLRWILHVNGDQLELLCSFVSVKHTLLPNIGHEVNVCLKLFNDWHKIKLIFDPLLRILFKIIEVKKVVLAILGGFDKEVSATLTEVDPTNQILGIFRKLDTENIFTLIGSKKVIVQLLILQTFCVSSFGILRIMVGVTAIENALSK